MLTDPEPDPVPTCGLRLRNALWAAAHTANHECEGRLLRNAGDELERLEAALNEVRMRLNAVNEFIIRRYPA